MLGRIALAAILILGASPLFGAPFTVGDAAAGNTGIGEWVLIDCPAGSTCAGATSGSPDATVEPVAGPYPLDGTWLANTGTSQWVSPVAGTQDVAGNYTYRVQFDLTGYLPGTASLSFQAAADDLLLDVLINDASTVVGPWYFVGFNAWNGPFEITSGFVAGVNTLDFVVENLSIAGAPIHPTGLRVEFLSLEADVPEPATMGLMGLGLLGLGVLRMRRKRV